MKKALAVLIASVFVAASAFAQAPAGLVAQVVAAQLVRLAQRPAGLRPAWLLLR